MKMSRENYKTYINIDSKPCVVCSEPAQIDTVLDCKGDKKKLLEWNLWAICVTHITEKESIGLTRFVEKYRLWNILEEKGFYYLEENNSYGHKLI
jgi:hypothetical protein